jgi:hypothetical protein
MAHTFDPSVGTGGSDQYQLDDPYGYQDREKDRQSLVVLGYLGNVLDLGGSDDVGLLMVSPPAWDAVRGYRQYDLTKEELQGLTVEAVVYLRVGAVSPPATSVQARVRDVTNGANAAISSASTSQSVASETLSVTLSAGAASYRLEIIGSDGAAEVYAWGYLRFRKVP